MTNKINKKSIEEQIVHFKGIKRYILANETFKNQYLYFLLEAVEQLSDKVKDLEDKLNAETKVETKNTLQKVDTPHDKVSDDNVVKENKVSSVKKETTSTNTIKSKTSK